MSEARDKPRPRKVDISLSDVEFTHLNALAVLVGQRRQDYVGQVIRERLSKHPMPTTLAKENQ